MAGGQAWVRLLFTGRSQVSISLQFLLAMLFLVRLADADGRRSFQDLSESWMGQAYNVRGGSSIIPFYRSKGSSRAFEQESVRRLKQEGYDLRQGLHGIT